MAMLMSLNPSLNDIIFSHPANIELSQSSILIIILGKGIFDLP
jgi:hypothetical protein